MTTWPHSPHYPSVPQGRCPGCGQTQRITGRGTWEMHSRSVGCGTFNYSETQKCPRATKPAPPGAHVEWLRAEGEAARKRLALAEQDEAVRHKQYQDACAQTLRAAAQAGLYAAALRALGEPETPGGDAATK